MPRSEAINPRVINFFAYVHWAFPIAYMLTMGTMYNLPVSKILSLFLSTIYLVHSCFAVFVGWSLYRMKPYAWHVFLFNSIIIIAEQFYIAFAQAENYTVEIPLFLSVTGTMAAVYMVHSELRVPYFSPKIAWWEGDPRYKISVPSHITTPDHYYSGEIMDISCGGCFIKSIAPLRADQIITVNFSLFDHAFTCSGRVVWATESAVTHPKGVGVKFLGMSKVDSVALRNTVKKLKGLSQKFRKLRHEEKMSTFEKKVDTLLGSSSATNAEGTPTPPQRKRSF